MKPAALCNIEKCISLKKLPAVGFISSRTFFLLFLYSQYCVY